MVHNRRQGKGTQNERPTYSLSTYVPMGSLLTSLLSQREGERREAQKMKPTSKTTDGVHFDGLPIIRQHLSEKFDTNGVKVCHSMMKEQSCALVGRPL
jgi:hypothetical protein